MTTARARAAAVATLLLALFVWTCARPTAAPAPPPALATTLPLAVDGWLGRDAPPLDPDVARVLAADEYVHRYYGRRAPQGRQVIEMDIAYYARPQTGAALHSPLSCLPGNGWQIVESYPTTLAADGAAWTVRRLTVDRKGYRVAMAYWYQHRGAVLGNEYRQRLRLLTDGLTGRPADAALVRVMAHDDGPGHRALEDFARMLLVRMRRAFR